MIWVSTLRRITPEVQHSPTVPDAPSKRSSVKDTLFLSKVGSERTEGKRGDVAALGAEPFPQPAVAEPRRDRVGELGQRKIPGLCLTGWVFSVQQRRRWKKNRDAENKTEGK